MTKLESLSNQKWVLKSHPKGDFVAKRDAELVEETIDLSVLKEDDLVVEVQALSIDAFIRTTLDKKSYHMNVGVGNSINAIGYGKVVKGNKQFSEGTIVQGLLEASKYSMVSKEASAMMTKKMDLPRVSPHASLGVLGISGIAAYVGMFVSPGKGRGPKKGETVVVSAAAGAVGCIAAQMALLTGATVIGVAGGETKKRFLLDELKLDGAVDYKCKEKTIGEQLDELCPNGIDFFFDNVGGQILDEVLQRINLYSRISICGAASQYNSGKINDKSSIEGPSHYVKLAEMSSTMSGFNMMHFSKSFPAAIMYLFWHYYRGNIHCPEHVETGIESFGKSIEMMFSGGHSNFYFVSCTCFLMK
eukprot:CAMPEP_0178980438 /NCGR_PEP_ID=MMETSP0789-20121207/26501_1 /TAXON_ID=3005 /ORGANISM="Rhizosolenia setigera, Strain CCMP 1694" /LENGTH=359 /DNA_ID=CAMNT_0020670861 /DNA_START=113 /DNA_END=1192 /DNA_ORIENTATION=-